MEIPPSEQSKQTLGLSDFAWPESCSSLDQALWPGDLDFPGD